MDTYSVNQGHHTLDNENWYQATLAERADLTWHRAGVGAKKVGVVYLNSALYASL